MKTKAIIRIVLFSIAIFVLLGILGLGLGITSFMVDFDEREHSDEISHAPAQMDSEAVTVDPGKVRELEIEWAAGSITIQPSEDISEIRICETESSDEKYRMVCTQSGDTLSIQFSSESVRFPSFGLTADLSKDLLIQVPMEWGCEVLEIDAASADVKITDMIIGEMDFDGASGVCELVNCIVGIMDIDAASGDVSFSGTLVSLDFDGTSADCTLVLGNCPHSIDLDGMSGDLDITLPSDCGFTVRMNGLSSSFSSDFDTRSHDDTYIYGDGTCMINVDAMSGKLCLRDGGYPRQS